MSVMDSYKLLNYGFWILIILSFGPTLNETTTDDPYWFIPSINRTATQSSTRTNGEASRAVDGKVAPKPDSCSLTVAATHTYIVIDFGRTLYIPLTIIHIDENVKIPYNNVEVKTGDHPVHTANELVKKIFLGKFTQVSNIGKRGRYLSIDVFTTEKEPLSICEIFAYRIPVDSITFRKPVTMSIVPNQPVNHPKESLVDMNWATFAFSHMAVNPWIRVDLLDTYYVTEVILVLYPGHSFRHLKIAIGFSLMDQGKSNPSCAEIPVMGIGEARSFDCDLKGRYVVLTRDGSGSIGACELVVNPSHSDNIAEGAAVTISSGIPYYRTRYTVTDCFFHGGIISADVETRNWLRVDLHSSLPVAKIFIVNTGVEEYTDEMVDFELRIGDSMFDNGNANPLCLPGLQNMLGKTTGSFFCEPRVTGRYVNVHQPAGGKRIALSEIAVYSESPPEIKDREKPRQFWHKEGAALTLSCEANGYPAPVISWLKDDVVIQTGSNILNLGSAARFNQSGTYECWANNTHGKTFKPIDVRITNDLRMCVESLQVSYDLGGIGDTYPVKEQEFLGNKWYHFYELSTERYLQMANSAPGNRSVCSGWVSGSHPGVWDEIVERNVCVKENGGDCYRQFTIRIRSCVGFYVYNLPSSLEAFGFKYCFKTETRIDETPAAAVMVGGANSALFNHILQHETEIENSSLCLQLCSLTDQCQSFNFSDKEKICELNNSTKDKHPSSFQPRNGYYYYKKGRALLSREPGEL